MENYCNLKIGHWLKKLCIDGRIMDGQYFIQFCLFYKYSTISILIGQYN